jgi:polyisoprenoid-binding protein YceI
MPSGGSDDMKMTARVRVFAIGMAIAAMAWLPAPAEEAAPAGSITFTARNRMATAHGVFHTWRIVRAEIDPADPGRGVVEVEVDVASVDTGIERRDKHLRTADFFEVEKFPTARVRVHDTVADGESERGYPRYRAKFDVRIRGVEKTVEGVFELVSASPPTVDGTLTLNRVDFGVGKPYSWWNPASVREEIPLGFTATFADQQRHDGY